MKERRTRRDGWMTEWWRREPLLHKLWYLIHYINQNHPISRILILYLCRMTNMCLTCNFVTDQFARFHFSNRGEKTTNFFLSHSLRQVVTNEIGLAILGSLWRRCRSRWSHWVYVVTWRSVRLLRRRCLHSVHLVFLGTKSLHLSVYWPWSILTRNQKEWPKEMG